MNLFGFTINMITLMALSLCVGLLIDDAIVVRENIVRHVGMGKALAESFPEARAVFEAADDALKEKLSTLCFEGPEDALKLTANTQPAIVATSAALVADYAASVRRHLHVMPDLHQRTLADYRQHYAAYKLDPDLRACHAAHPWLMVWDDHEVAADYTGRHSPDLPDPQAFLAIRTAAYQAYFEHLPLSPHRAPVAGSMPLHGRYTWGQLAELMTVDTRQFRDPAVCEGRHAPLKGKLLWQCDAAQAAERTMLGQRQGDDLAAHLASSASDWKFIVQSSQLSPGVLRSPLGPLLYADGWDAYPTARRRLTEAIAQPRVPDVVCLGGDVHRHVAANLRLDPADPASPIIASEIVTTSVSSRGLSELMSSWVKRGNPDLLHVRGDERGYTLLDVTPQQVLCEFRSTPHPVRADSRLRTQARYVIERGQPGPRKA